MLNDCMEIKKRGKTDVARTSKHVMVGPWVHGVATRDNFRPEAANQTDRVDFGATAAVDLLRLQLRWDHWLKGINNGVAQEPPVKIFVMGENYWRYENVWPVARTRYTNYYLRSGGHANSLNGDGVLDVEAPNYDDQGDTNDLP